MIIKIAWVGSNSNDVCFKDTEKCHVKTEAEFGIMWPQALGCLALPEADVTNCYKLGGLKQ